MSIGSECSRIGKSEAKNLFFLSFFDKRSFDETFEYIGEYAYYVDVHEF